MRLSILALMLLCPSHCWNLPCLPLHAYPSGTDHSHQSHNWWENVENLRLYIWWNFGDHLAHDCEICFPNSLSFSRVETLFLEIKSSASEGGIFYHKHTLALLLFFFFVFFFFETGSHCVAQVSLKLAIFLPLFPKYWDYSCVPPHPAWSYI
jgi:hypothetical protein